jgi:predicted P-loop ATPase
MTKPSNDLDKYRRMQARAKRDAAAVEQFPARRDRLKAVRADGKAPRVAADSPDWPDVNKYGVPQRTYRNARAAIEALGVICRYDVFHDRKLVGGDVLEEWAGEFSDAVSAILRQMIVDRYDFDPGKDNVNDAAIGLCVENAFDPILDYLNGLTWDGEDRLGTWLATYLGAETSTLNSEVGKLVLVSAVRRVRQPGCKFDHIVTLEGLEGTMKSTAVQVLAAVENFSDQTILTATDKEQQELVRGVWIYEIADLAGMKRTDVEKIKAFVSRTHDRTRPAYGRHRVDAPRRCVFFGTTNDDGYLKSQTGNRRFWPVRTGTIDIDALRRDRDQLWAQAAAVEATGLPLILPDALWPEARAAQEERRERDPWEDILSAATGTVYASDHGDEERIRTSELLKDKLGISDKEVTTAHALRVKRAMTALGWRGPKMLRFGGRDTKPERGYCRPANTDRE